MKHASLSTGECPSEGPTPAIRICLSAINFIVIPALSRDPEEAECDAAAGSRSCARAQTGMTARQGCRTKQINPHPLEPGPYYTPPITRQGGPDRPGGDGSRDADAGRKDPGRFLARREGSCAAIAAHEWSAKETSAAGMGLTALPQGGPRYPLVQSGDGSPF